MNVLFSEYFCHNYGTRIFNSSVMYREFQRRGIRFAFTARLSLTVDRTEKSARDAALLVAFLPALFIAVVCEAHRVGGVPHFSRSAPPSSFLRGNRER